MLPAAIQDSVSKHGTAVAHEHFILFPRHHQWDPAGGKLEKGPAAVVSCFEDILRATVPPPPPAVPSPVPLGAEHMSATLSAFSSPVHPAVPLQGSPGGAAVMEDAPPRSAPTPHLCLPPCPCAGHAASVTVHELHIVV